MARRTLLPLGSLSALHPRLSHAPPPTPLNLSAASTPARFDKNVGDGQIERELTLGGNVAAGMKQYTVRTFTSDMKASLWLYTYTL